MSQRRTDEIALQEVMDLAKRQSAEDVAKMRAELEGTREEAHALGILQTLDYQNAHNEMLKYVVLMRLRDAKEYRKSGRTWAQFCEQVMGESKPQVDKKIADIRPVVEAFGSKMSHLVGLELRQIRLLGRSLGSSMSQIEDGAVVIGEEKIPLTPEHADDLEAALEALLKAKDAEVEAQKKLVAQKQTTLDKRDAEITVLEGKVAEGEEKIAAIKAHRTVDETEFFRRIESWRLAFEAFLHQFEPGDCALMAEATPRMRAGFIEVMSYFHRQITLWKECAVDYYGDARVDPSGWIPPDQRGPRLVGPDADGAE